MPKEFVVGQHVIAQWQEGPGGKWWLNLHDAVLSTQDGISAFREWVDEGPPAPCYRITRSFKHMPSYVYTPNEPDEWISDGDIEEVWE